MTFSLNPRLIALYAAIISTPCALAAEDSNSVYIFQVGHNNVAGTYQQENSDNRAHIQQVGDNHNNALGDIHAVMPQAEAAFFGIGGDIVPQTQLGQRNNATIFQNGYASNAIQYQHGNDNRAILYQNGFNAGNAAVQIQVGNENFSEIRQAGSGLYAESVQDNVNAGHIFIEQHGIGHRTAIFQSGAGDNSATVVQY